MNQLRGFQSYRALLPEKFVRVFLLSLHYKERRFQAFFLISTG